MYVVQIARNWNAKSGEDRKDRVATNKLSNFYQRNWLNICHLRLLPENPEIVEAMILQDNNHVQAKELFNLGCT